MRSTVNERRQITLAPEALDELGVEPGDEVEVVVGGGVVRIEPTRRTSPRGDVMRLAGSLRAYAGPAAHDDDASEREVARLDDRTRSGRGGNR